jgi:hypothetical protein
MHGVWSHSAAAVWQQGVEVFPSCCAGLVCLTLEQWVSPRTGEPLPFPQILLGNLCLTLICVCTFFYAGLSAFCMFNGMPHNKKSSSVDARPQLCAPGRSHPPCWEIMALTGTVQDVCFLKICQLLEGCVLLKDLSAARNLKLIAQSEMVCLHVFYQKSSYFFLVFIPVSWQKLRSWFDAKVGAFLNFFSGIAWCGDWPPTMNSRSVLGRTST